MVLPSAEKTRLTRFILSKKLLHSTKLTADGNTILNLPWHPRKNSKFFISTFSFYVGSMYLDRFLWVPHLEAAVALPR
jgi:hypothetical protein